MAVSFSNILAEWRLLVRQPGFKPKDYMFLVGRELYDRFQSHVENPFSDTFHNELSFCNVPVELEPNNVWPWAWDLRPIAKVNNTIWRKINVD